jgi:serine/threonine protein phosphatase PrpC
MNALMLKQQQALNLEAAALTDRGQKRKLNEDAVFHRTVQTRRGDHIGLYIVCDGLGGHQAGEVASRLAIEIVTNELAEIFFLPGPSAGGYFSYFHFTLRLWIQKAIRKANVELRSYAEAHHQKGGNLGTTITLALIYGNQALIANVGDSRAYAWRSGQMTQITSDHSWVAKLAAEGLIDETEVAQHPRSNVLLQALGTCNQVDVDLFDWTLQAGDKLLLCSDGLWQAFPDPVELGEWLGSATMPSELCQQLVTEANQRDGSDNISVVVVNVDNLFVSEAEKEHNFAKVNPGTHQSLKTSTYFGFSIVG